MQSGTGKRRLYSHESSLLYRCEGVECLYDQKNMSIKTVISEDMLDHAVSGHLYILIFALIFMSVLMAIVGGLGLMSTMDTNVIERTRELGIMRNNRRTIGYGC